MAEFEARGLRISIQRTGTYGALAEVLLGLLERHLDLYAVERPG